MALRSLVHFTPYQHIHVSPSVLVTCPVYIDWRSTLATWLRTKDVEPPAPLTPYQGGAASYSSGQLTPYRSTQEVQSFTPGQLIPYRYIPEVHDYPNTS